MANRELTDAILDNEEHSRRVAKAQEREQEEKATRKEAIAARRKANKNTAFNQLPAEEKQKYSELVKIVPNSKGFTAYQRIDAIFAYFVTGRVREAARLCNINENTILTWAQSSWWKSAIQKVKELKQEELDVQYTSIIDQTVGEIVDRIQNGDERLNRDGEAIRVKVGAKDLMLVNAMAFDKRALLRRDPTEISQKTITVEDRNKILSEQFRKIAKEGTLIEGEVIETNEEITNG